MKKLPFSTVKNLSNEETLQMLAEMWSQRTFREYMINLRNIYIQETKKIKTGTIEGDALELQRNNGRVEAIEKLMQVAQNCYEDFEKIKSRRTLASSELSEMLADDEPHIA